MFNTPELPGVDLPGIDICAIARGFGCETVRVETSCDLVPALTRSFASAGPVVIDVILDRPEAELY